MSTGIEIDLDSVEIVGGDNNFDEPADNEITDINDISELEDIVVNEDENENDVDGLENNDDEASNGNNAYLLAKALKDEGILTYAQDDELKNVSDVDGIALVIKNQVDKMFLDKVKEEYGETGEKLYQLKQEGGDVSGLLQIDNDLQAVSQFTDDVLESELEENVAQRKALIMYDFTLRGMTQEEAAQIADTFIATKQDVAKAKQSKLNVENYLNKTRAEIYTEENAKITAKKNESVNFVSNVKTKLKETKEILPSFNVDDKLRNTILDSIIKPVGKVNDKQVNRLEKWLAENPIDAQIKLHYLYEITDGFTKFDDIVTTAKSKAAKALDSKFKDGAFNIDGGNRRKNEYFGTNKNMVSPNEW